MILRMNSATELGHQTYQVGGCPIVACARIKPNKGLIVESIAPCSNDRGENSSKSTRWNSGNVQFV